MSTLSGPSTVGTQAAAPITRRILAPDLARGAMLLVIALAHAYLFTELIGGPGAVHTGTDRIAAAGTVLFVDFRGYPMFAALFGYGIAQIHRRRTGQGHEWPWVRALLRRRARWLIVFGLVHVALLFFGDILAVYGLVALIFVGMLRFGDRALAVLAMAWLPLGVFVNSGLNYLLAGAAPPGDGSAIPEGLLNELIFRLGIFLVIGTMMFFSAVVPFLLGVLAARHRLLEEPHRHMRLLRTTALAGIPVAVLGGLPLALEKTGVWADPSSMAVLSAMGLHQVTGYAGGLGYAALIALLAVGLADRQGPVTKALSALGERSLTFYLAQSVVWAALFASYTLHLQVTSPTIAVGIAVATWLTTVVLADLMRRRGARGPAEAALRRLTYGPYR